MQFPSHLPWGVLNAVAFASTACLAICRVQTAVDCSCHSMNTNTIHTQRCKAHHVVKHLLHTTSSGKQRGTRTSHQDNRERTSVRGLSWQPGQSINAGVDQITHPLASYTIASPTKRHGLRSFAQRPAQTPPAYSPDYPTTSRTPNYHS